MNPFLETYQMLASFSHRFFINVHYFFGIDFRIYFFHRLFMKMAPKTAPKSIRWWDHFGSLFATFSEGRFFNVFWSPLGSLSASFWRHVTHFWFTFGALWLTFGALGVTLAIDFLIFGASWHLFSYWHVISMKILCKIILFENCH